MRHLIYVVNQTIVSLFSSNKFNVHSVQFNNSVCIIRQIRSKECLAMQKYYWVSNLFPSFYFMNLSLHIQVVPGFRSSLYEGHLSLMFIVWWPSCELFAHFCNAIFLKRVLELRHFSKRKQMLALFFSSVPSHACSPCISAPHLFPTLRPRVRPRYVYTSVNPCGVWVTGEQRVSALATKLSKISHTSCVLFFCAGNGPFLTQQCIFQLLAWF